MNTDEIIEMAREADLDWHTGWTLDDEVPNRFEAFAKLVAAKEREEILNMCEPPEHSHQFVHTFKKLIRARGESNG